MSSLRSSSVTVLLFPEDLPSTAGISSPVYGTATMLSDPVATVTLLSSPSVHLQVPNDIVRHRQVDAAEHGNGAPGEWLRKAVVGLSAQTYVLGQVVDYSGSLATIRTLRGEFQSDIADLREVSPVHCFLFGKHEVHHDQLSLEDMNEQLAAVLDRILGSTGRGSRAINRNFGRFCPSSRPPTTGRYTLLD